MASKNKSPKFLKKLKAFTKSIPKKVDPQEIKNKLINLKQILENEKEHSLDMIETYLRYTKGLASEEEMSEANKQFKNFLKTVGLGVFIVLPGSPVTLPLLVKLGHKFGIDIIPSAFKKNSPKGDP